MIRRVAGHIIAGVLALVLGLSGSAGAHALPGSILTFWQAKGQLNLTIHLPLEDLVVAVPRLADLYTLPPNQDIPAAQAERVSQYFSDHLALHHASDGLPLTVTRAAVQMGENEDVGPFPVLVVELATDLPTNNEVFPLSLSYDAIMHEVRNHRATVFWQVPPARPRMVADFGFRPNASGVVIQGSGS